MRWSILVQAVLLAAALPFAVLADNAPPIRMGPPFVEGAVLQRGMPVPVWGWSNPGMRVKVIFQDQVKEAVAGEDGKWAVELEPLEATAKPQWMVVEAAGKGLMLSDLLVGEVWVASGQSNMQWLANKSDVGRVLQKQIGERVEAGQEKPAIIREAKVTDVYSALHPINYASVEWSDDAADMSAIAYAFAYELWRELQVPIGIVNCSFSSTSIEAWTPREGFATGLDDPHTRELHRRVLETDPTTTEHKEAWQAYYAEVEAAMQTNRERIAEGKQPLPIKFDLPGNLRGNRDASWLYNARMYPFVPYAVRGAIWNQGYANIGGGFDYYANLHSLIKGWRQAWNRPDLPVYFHQFYSAAVDEHNHPALGQAADMRLGTWLARDIPNTGMASQIDIEGSIHYFNKALPGQRLARHALKQQYGKDIVADGPMFKSYEVNGNELVVSLDHAEGGLVVAETGTNRKDIATPTPVPEGASAVTLFYLADNKRVWHRATVQIKGEKLVLSAPGLDQPCGVSYGSGGIGFQPNIYNRAMLPLTPFTVYRHELVTVDDWPDDPVKIAGYEPAPGEGGLQYEYRKMPLLSTQFRDNAVLQHGVPVTIWGSAVHDWGYEAEGEAVIKFSFGEVKKTIEVMPGMKEWSVTLDPMKPSAQPRTLRVVFEIDGQVVHERMAENVVIGDVWFVAAPAFKDALPDAEPLDADVRVMQRKAKRDGFHRPSRYSVAVSTTPGNRFASQWRADQSGLAGMIGQRIAAKTGHPVGIIFMQSNAGKDQPNPPIKSWLPFEALAEVPSLAEDYATVGTRYPGSPSYDANVRRYLDDWKAYWSDYVPQMMSTRRVPDGSAWGVMPSFDPPDAKTQATECYNVMVHSFTPAAVKGVLFIAGPAAVGEEQDSAATINRLSALGTSWRERFGGSPAMMYIATGGVDPASVRGWRGGYLHAYKMTDGPGSLPVIDSTFLNTIDSVLSEVYR